MRRLCPSINELMAFEATARHGSITRAAMELCVTQGAVSRQILGIEEWLGVKLFERIKQRLVLTDTGRSYLAKVRPSLDALEAATVELRAHRGAGGMFTLACVPTFGAKWLIPRLPAFMQRHPDINLSFVPYAQSAEFLTSGGPDAAIRFGEGVWPNTVAEYVAGRELLAIAAPGIAQAIRQPDNVAEHTLLHHTSVPHAWEDWRAATGIARLETYVGPRFDQYSVLIQGAIAGLGVALVPECLVRDELASGVVRAVFSNTIKGWKGYYLCYPDDRQHLSSLVEFRNWLLEQANMQD